MNDNYLKKQKQEHQENTPDSEHHHVHFRGSGSYVDS